VADSLLPELLEQLSKTQWTVRDIQHADNTPYADVCTIDCKLAMVVAATSGVWAAHTPSVRLAMRDVYTYAAVEATVVLPRHEPPRPLHNNGEPGPTGTRSSYYPAQTHYVANYSTSLPLPALSSTDLSLMASGRHPTQPDLARNWHRVRATRRTPRRPVQACAHRAPEDRG
jgi:hypothetical protein